MKQLFHLTVLLLSLSSLHAQRPDPLERTAYYKTSAQQRLRNTPYYQLKGRVASMKTIVSSGRQQDTSFYLFDLKGRLVHLESSSNQQAMKPQEDYTYAEDGQLIGIHSYWKTGWYGTSRTDSFGTNGYLIKSILQETEDNTPRRTILYYSYNTDHTLIQVNYNYHFPTTNYDVPLQDIYTLRFNKKGQLISERSASRHGEHTYVSKLRFYYDTLTGRLTNMLDKDSCDFEGQNSCANISISYRYDDKGRIVGESCSDATVRNATWSYGYQYTAHYNAKDELISESHAPTDGRQYGFDQQGSLNKTTGPFQYEYDAKGNWICRYVMKEKHKIVVVRREIEYEK